MGYPVAYFLVRSKSSKIRGTILMLIVIPNLVNYLIYMLALILMLRDHGIINETLIFLRIIREPIPLMYSEVAVLIGILIWCLPYVVLSLTGSIQSIDTALEDAAQSLGASKLQTFVKITFPLSLPGIALAALLAFVGGITSFVAPLMLGGGHVSFISNLIYNKVVVLSDYPFGSAASVILLSVSLMIMFGINKLLMRKFKVQ
jgi:spermidine/putrescine transport system permease protein